MEAPKSRGLIKMLLLLVISVNIISYSGKAQDIKSLQVSGSSVQFIFSSLSNYNNGIELDGWTRLKIKYKFSGTGWKLLLKASDSYILYEGDAGNDIPVGDLELITTLISSDDPTTSITNSLNPSVVDQVLATGNGGNPDQVNVEITINYRLGFPPNTMINKPGGIYFVSLYFLLKEI
jgi:hypothetical protein